MHRTGKIKLCLLAVLACSVAAAVVAGCGKDEHTHSFSDEWAFDSEAHWHPSSCGHDVKANKSAHAFDTVVVPPTASAGGYTLHICACGYSYTSDETGALPGETGDWRYNADGHWKAVYGEGTVQPEEHDFEDETIAPTCAAMGYTKHTCVCGYWYATDPTAPVAHTTDEEVWAHNETEHWQPCLVCGMKVNPAAHNVREYVTTPATCEDNGHADFICTDCGATLSGRDIPAGHRFADTFTGDEYEHWRPAVCEHEGEKADVEDHIFFGNSNVCAFCGKTVTPRIAYALSADKEYYIVTGIGSFQGTAVEIPAEFRGLPVREIAPRAFENEAIESVTIGNNVVKIGTKAFAGTAIESVTVGETVESVGQGAFRDCTSLTTATLNSAALATIPYDLFFGCSQLQTVSGSVKVKTVRAQAFYGCAALTGIDLSECTAVEFSAFGGCTLLNNVTSLAVLAAAEEYAFAGSGLAAAELPALREVPDKMFEGSASLTSVTLSAEIIGAEAFSGCTTLSTVSLTGTTTIGAKAFAGCTALDALELPETVVRVGAGAFEGSGLIAEEGGVKYAANIAVGLASGTAPALKEGTVGIADEAFMETAITEITLSDEVRFLGANAFRKCESLTAFTFKDGVRSIGANAFRESGLVNITVPATVQTVGENAFYDCMSLTTVSVSAKEIGRFAFSYTGVGRTLNSPIKVRPAGAKLATLTIGEGVENIGSNAFQYAPIGEVTLPASLKTVGQYAFAQTDLAAVTVPAAVTRIGAHAFYNTKLATATFTTQAGWTAGGAALNLATPANNATQLKAADIDWIRG